MRETCAQYQGPTVIVEEAKVKRNSDKLVNSTTTPTASEICVDRKLGSLWGRVWSTLLRSVAILSVLLPLISREPPSLTLILALILLIALKPSLLASINTTLTLAILPTVAGAALGWQLSVSSTMLVLARRWTLRSHIENGTWNILGCVINIELLVNGLWDRLNFGTELLFDFVKIEAIIPVDQIDC